MHLLRPLGAAALAAAALPLAAADPAEAPVRWSVSLEGWNPGTVRNDAAVRGDDGTRFSLAGLTGRSPIGVGRVTVEHTPGRGGEWRLMLQPLFASGTGTFDRTVRFAGADFAAGTPTRGTYRFNSHRLTWRNTWIRRPGAHWRVGGTLKVRDAEIALTQGGLSRRKRDLGVVPLLHVAGEQTLAPGWTLETDLDAAWAPQGRAIDLGVRVARDLDARTRAFVGFRLLEGGADNDAVYTFSQFQGLSAGLTVRW